MIPIRQNSFFEEFNKIRIEECLEVVKCLIALNLSAKKAFTFLNEEKFIKLSLTQIRNIYHKIRETIYYYYLLEYEIEDFGLENQNHHFSLDESMFCHDLNGRQIWVLGMIENETKSFRVVCSYNRDANVIKSFIEKYIPKGNHIIHDGWPAYSFLNNPNSGYIPSIHVHGRHDFCYGLDSTSHIEVYGEFYSQK